MNEHYIDQTKIVKKNYRSINTEHIKITDTYAHLELFKNLFQLDFKQDTEKIGWSSVSIETNFKW